MVDHYNPGSVGDFSGAGMSTGSGSESLVFALGLAIDPTTGARCTEADTVAAETRICFDNIRAILAEAELSVSDIVKTTCYFSDEKFRFEFFDAYKAMFGEGPYPARNSFVLGIAADCRVQIEAVAVRAAAR